MSSSNSVSGSPGPVSGSTRRASHHEFTEGGLQLSQPLLVSYELARRASEAGPDAPNLRPQMPLLKEMRYRTNGIPSNLSLSQWWQDRQMVPTSQTAIHSTILRYNVKSAQDEKWLSGGVHHLTTALAKKLDHWATRGIFDHRPKLIPYALLTGHQGVDASQLTTKDGAVVSNEFNRISRIFWEHMLFDRMAAFVRPVDATAGVPSIPPDKERLAAARQGILVQRLMKKGVNHWVKTLDDTASQTKSWYHDAYRPDSESPTQGTLPPGPSGNQTSLDVTLSMEAELSRRLQERNRSFVVPQILLNLELAAYYLLVLINSPTHKTYEDGKKGLMELSQRYKALGHQTQSTYTMQQMRMPLVIALCLSPLALMSSSSTGFNSKVPLLDLWQMGYALGNTERPAAITTMENVIWSAIFSVALGASADAELYKIVKTWDAVSCDHSMLVRQPKSYPAMWWVSFPASADSFKQPPLHASITNVDDEEEEQAAPNDGDNEEPSGDGEEKNDAPEQDAAINDANDIEGALNIISGDRFMQLISQGEDDQWDMQAGITDEDTAIFAKAIETMSRKLKKIQGSSGEHSSKGPSEPQGTQPGPSQATQSALSSGFHEDDSHFDILGEDPEPQITTEIEVVGVSGSSASAAPPGGMEIGTSSPGPSTSAPKISVTSETFGDGYGGAGPPVLAPSPEYDMDGGGWGGFSGGWSDISSLPRCAASPDHNTDGPSNSLPDPPPEDTHAPGPVARVPGATGSPKPIQHGPDIAMADGSFDGVGGGHDPGSPPASVSNRGAQAGSPGKGIIAIDDAHIGLGREKDPTVDTGGEHADANETEGRDGMDIDGAVSVIPGKQSENGQDSDGVTKPSKDGHQDAVDVMRNESFVETEKEAKEGTDMNVDPKEMEKGVDATAPKEMSTEGNSGEIEEGGMASQEIVVAEQTVGTDDVLGPQDTVESQDTGGIVERMDSGGLSQAVRTEDAENTIDPSEQENEEEHENSAPTSGKRVVQVEEDGDEAMATGEDGVADNVIQTDNSDGTDVEIKDAGPGGSGEAMDVDTEDVGPGGVPSELPESSGSKQGNSEGIDGDGDEQDEDDDEGMDPEALEAAREARKQRRIALKEQRIADAANSLAANRPRRDLEQTKVVPFGAAVFDSENPQIKGSPSKTSTKKAEPLADIEPDDEDPVVATSGGTKAKKVIDLSPRKLNLVDESSLKPLEFTFEASPNCATNEYRLFDEIYESIQTHNTVEVVHESLGDTPIRIPRHLNEESRDCGSLDSPEAPPRSENASCVFTIHWNDLAMLPKGKLQSIFKDRSILIKGMPLEKVWEWDELSFSELAPLWAFVDVQDMVDRDRKGAKTIQMNTRVRMIDVVRAVKERRRLNVLDLPQGHRDLAHMAGYAEVATHERIIQRVDYLEKSHHVPRPASDLSWAIATTGDVTSRVHVDTAGLATASVMLRGTKLWCIQDDRRQPQYQPKTPGAFDRFNSSRGGPREMPWEGVLLQAGDVLLMRPCQRHYVLTLLEAIVFGKHFYSASTIRETCYGIIQSFLFNAYITNTEHAHVLYLVPEFLPWWLEHYELDNSAFMASPNFDVIPKLETQEGRLTVLLVGCMAVFFDSLDPRKYLEEAQKPEKSSSGSPPTKHDEDVNPDLQDKEEYDDDYDDDGTTLVGDVEVELEVQEEEQLMERSAHEEKRLGVAKKAFMRLLMHIGNQGYCARDDDEEDVWSIVPDRWYLPMKFMVHFATAVYFQAERNESATSVDLSFLKKSLVSDLEAFVPTSYADILSDILQDHDVEKFEMREGALEDSAEFGWCERTGRWIAGDAGDDLSCLKPPQGTPYPYSRIPLPPFASTDQASASTMAAAAPKRKRRAHPGPIRMEAASSTARHSKRKKTA